MRELCWNIKTNGRYCKNYKLKNDSACYMHTTNQSFKENESLSLIYKMFLMLLCVSSLFVYKQNEELINQWASLMLDSLKEYLIQLYKTDKNMYYIYLRACSIHLRAYYVTLFGFILNKGIYIMKMLN